MKFIWKKEKGYSELEQIENIQFSLLMSLTVQECFCVTTDGKPQRDSKPVE